MTEHPKYNTGFLLFISIASALGGLLFGYDLLVISGAKQFYELTYSLETPALQGWAVSSCIVGCIIGALFVGRLTDKFGRVKLLLVSALLFLVSALGSGYAPDFTQFVLYRLLGGIGMGMASTLSPMYIAEVSPAALRGRLVSLNQLTIVIGILLAQYVNYQISEYKPIDETLQQQSALAADLETQVGVVVNIDKATGGYLPGIFSDAQREAILEEGLLNSVPRETLDVAVLSQHLRESKVIPTTVLNPTKLRDYTNAQLAQTWNGTTGWRIMFAAEGIPAVLFLVLMLMVPESPRWLVKNSRDEDARKVLGRIGGADYASKTLVEIESTLDDAHKKAGVGALFKPSVIGIVIMGVVIAVYQQWCGINVIFNYAPDIFRAAGFKVGDIMFNLVIIGLTNMAFTFVGMALIDRLGRKPLMIIGSAGLLFSYIAIGTCYATGATGWYVVGFALLAIAFFAATLGPVAWVFISEIFPNAIRGTAMSVAVLSLWIANFILSFTFPILNAALGSSYTFWLYAAICLVGIFYIKAKVPETKGKTLEEIEKELTR